MKRRSFSKSLISALTLWTLVVMPLAAQTRISMPKNKYKVQDDVKIGNDAAVQVEKQFPILNDAQAQRYVESVGERLVRATPAQFQQSAFDYRFKVVNARDINAFALPGGPMYVNRGMIEAAKNEGEMAGVMAHEISHVALRHATAQQTKVNNPLNQILGIGAILGGAILGGQSGAQLGQMVVAGRFLKYSREYETQADILGSQIMADAGYDPRDLANMFKTIEAQNQGGRAPEWLSSHPDPGNRYNNINREAAALRVSSNPIKVTREFSRTQERFRSMPRAQSMGEIEKAYGSGGQSTGSSPTANGNYSRSVAAPSARTRIYTSGSSLRMNVPDNWKEFPADGGVWFAPEGAYGNQGITHGVMLGIGQTRSNGLSQATREYVDSLLKANNYLQQNGDYSNETISGRQAYSTVLSGTSPVTGRTEVVTIYTTQLRGGNLFWAATVSPGQAGYQYTRAFRDLISSIRLNE